MVMMNRSAFTAYKVILCHFPGGRGRKGKVGGGVLGKVTNITRGAGRERGRGRDSLKKT